MERPHLLEHLLTLARPRARSYMWMGAVLGCLWSAAGCQSGPSTCNSDVDCRDDQVCARGLCLTTCQRDRDCERASYRCRPYTDPDEGKTLDLCQPPRDAAASDASAGCRSDRECRRQLDAERARCGINRRCITATAPPRYGLLVRDRTPDDGSEGEPGTELAAAVVARKGDGPSEAYAYADTLRFDPARRSDAGEPDSPLDGSAPTWTEDERCVRGDRRSSTVPLGGEGGSMLLGFVDAAGGNAELRGSDRVFVVEWGSNCGASPEASARYEVHLCVSYDETIDPDRHCRRRLGTGSGFASFALPDDLGS